MTTARDIVEDAAQLIHVLGEGDDLSAADAKVFLDALNDMIAMWSIMPAAIYNETREEFALTSGVADYTIGTGGDFDTTRPSILKYAAYKEGNQEYPIQIESQGEYAEINDKTQSGIPQYLYYDNNYPLANIRLDKKPTGGSLILYTRKPLDQFAGLTTAMSSPPEYKNAYSYNLAIDVAPKFERDPSAVVVERAAQYLGAVKKNNNRNDKNIMRVDPMLQRMSRRYNTFKAR